MSRTGSKLRKGIGTDGRDIITNLPECVLSHILSRLPLKDAVRTSVLSRAWENKWTSIYNIVIKDHLLPPRAESDNACFVNFVDWILFNIQYVRSFHFFIVRECDASHLRKWISVLFRRNIKSAAFHYLPGIFDPHSIIVLPRSFVNCTSLRELSIGMACTLKVSGKIYFPNLRDCYLYGVQILNDNSCIDTLTCTFPVLEKLELLMCKWLNVRVVEIHAPKLSDFGSSPPTLDEGVVFDNYIIKIFGAKISKFESVGIPENILLVGSTAVHVVIATTNIEDEIKLGTQVRRLLKDFASLGELTIFCSVTKAIVQAKPSLPLPKFDKLRRLSLSYNGWRDDHLFSTEGLFEVLHSAPYLKFLAIKMPSVMLPGSLGEYDDEGMQSVPSCIVSQLEEVNLKSFCSAPPQVDLVKFLLKVGARLKMFSVSCLQESNIDAVRQLLLGLPTASTCLTMVIT